MEAQLHYCLCQQTGVQTFTPETRERSKQTHWGEQIKLEKIYILYLNSHMVRQTTVKPHEASHNSTSHIIVCNPPS